MRPCRERSYPLQSSKKSMNHKGKRQIDALSQANKLTRVWRDVIKNILANNEEEALKCKTDVEEHQRALERERKKESKHWTPRLFHQVDEDYYIHKTLRYVYSYQSPPLTGYRASTELGKAKT